MARHHSVNDLVDLRSAKIFPQHQGDDAHVLDDLRVSGFIILALRPFARWCGQLGAGNFLQVGYRFPGFLGKRLELAPNPQACEEA
jgi:hypothetical protein